MALAHATGFCRSVWEPVIDEVRNRGFTGPVVAWDHRAHGDSTRPVVPVDWWDTAHDALAVLAGLTPPIVGVGHSMGAASLLMAEMLAPGTFTAIVAIEPIVFPPPYEPIDHHPLVQTARRRKPSFPSRAAALDNFGSKAVFAAWDPRSLQAYVRCGLLPAGDEWVLACPPEYEAAFFAAGAAHGAWERLGEVQVPVRVVAGRDSDSHPAEFAAEQAARLGNATLEIVAGSGHFLPMEQPGRVARHHRSDHRIDQLVVTGGDSPPIESPSCRSRGRFERSQPVEVGQRRAQPSLKCSRRVQAACELPPQQLGVGETIRYEGYCAARHGFGDGHAEELLMGRAHHEVRAAQQDGVEVVGSESGVKHGVPKAIGELGASAVGPSGLTGEDEPEAEVRAFQQAGEEPIGVLVGLPSMIPQHDGRTVVAVAWCIQQCRIDPNGQDVGFPSGGGYRHSRNVQHGKSGEEVVAVEARVEGNPVGYVDRAPVDESPFDVGMVPVVGELVFVQIEQRRNILEAGARQEIFQIHHTRGDDEVGSASGDACQLNGRTFDGRSPAAGLPGQERNVMTGVGLQALGPGPMRACEPRLDEQDLDPVTPRRCHRRRPTRLPS